jgi:hypothetical protein
MEGFIDTSFFGNDFSWDIPADFADYVPYADTFVPETPPPEEDSLEVNQVEYLQPIQFQIVEPTTPPTVQPVHVVEPVQTQLVVTSDLTITLLQKRRGNGGLWQPLAQDERIRVDKIKGKLVKLIVKSNGYNLSEKDWDVQLYLIDKAHPDQPIHPGDGFTIEQPTRAAKGAMESNCREFKLKLTKISKSQYFFVSASKLGQNISGYSLEFRSDDNGKVPTSKKRYRHELEPFVPHNQSNLICKDIGADNGLVSMIARSLVPIILDNFQNQLTTGSLEDNIAKRIKLAFAPQIKTEPLVC